MLFFTGYSRSASSVLKEQDDKISIYLRNLVRYSARTEIFANNFRKALERTEKFKIYQEKSFTNILNEIFG
jgi:hypothetical protein